MPEPRRALRRRKVLYHLLKHVLICLFTGLILNAAICYGSVLLFNWGYMDQFGGGDLRNIEAWRVEYWKGQLIDRLYAQRYGALGPEDSKAVTPLGILKHDESGVGVDVFREAAGWPMRSLFWEARAIYRNDDYYLPVKSLELYGAIPLVTPTHPHNVQPYHEAEALPYAPLWWGFCFDVLFLGLIGNVLVLATATLRKLRRRYRGRCERCNYDLKGATLDGCPECGWRRGVEALSPLRKRLMQGD